MQSSHGARASAEILGLILDCLPAFVVVCDMEMRFTQIRGTVLEEQGIDEAAALRLIGTSVGDFFSGPEGEPILGHVRESLRGGSVSFELPWGGRWYTAHTAPLRDERGRIVGSVGVGMDVTSRHNLQAQLEQDRALLEEAQLLAQAGSWVLDVATEKVEISRPLARLLGIPPQTEPMAWSELTKSFAPHDLQTVEAHRKRALESCGFYDIEHDVVRPDGVVRRMRSRGHVDCDERGNPLRCVGTMHDITERLEAQRTAEMLAYHDPLTGLPNRWLLQDRLENAIASAAREDRQIFAVFIDLDDFKRINDSLGHALGDVMLAEVGHRLYNAARSSDTVARMGGDEFVVVLTHVENDEQLQTALRKIRGVFRAPFRLADSEYAVTASMGVAGYPADALEPGGLLRDADAAMYEAKQRGRNAVQRYSGTSIASSMQRVQFELDLRRAVREHEFEVFYQPIVNAGTGRTLGVEALLRWRHPTQGLLLPLSFLHTIEHTEYANSIGEWVLREACTQVARWRKDLGMRLRLSVNVSAVQLQRDYFTAVLKNVLQETQMRPDAIDIELTENTVVHDLESAAAVLGRVRELGVGVAIDDFGTGYNSLSYLKHFPITGLKIDRSFVSEMGVDAFDEAISSAVIALGKALQIRVVAEGVERETQLSALVALGCEEIQGNYFAPAMEARDLNTRLLQEAALE